MLKKIEINNFVLIEHQVLNFDKQLNVLTGDTGSGKSVIVNSIKFITGSRANSDMFFDDEKPIVVTATISVTPELKSDLEKRGFEVGSEIEVMRKLTPKGNARIRLDGELISASELKEILSPYFAIYSQYSVAKFKDANNYSKIIDDFANSENELKIYQSEFESYKQLKAEIASLRDRARLRDERQELLEMRLKELSFIDDRIDIDELIKEREELEGLASQFQVKDKANAYFERISSELGELMQTVKLDSHLNLLNEALVNIEEVNFELANQTSDFDETRLSFIEDYISDVRRVCRKYSVEQSKLVDFKIELENEMMELSSIDSDIQNLESRLDKQYQKSYEVAKVLSEKRNENLPQFVSKVNEYMAELSLEGADFKVISNEIELQHSGFDDISFDVRMNEGGNYSQIHKTASGGEIARFLLALEAVTSEFSQERFIIFDEIDTGVSGNVGSLMAKLMMKISRKNKLLIITHLAQVAAISENHFVISKQSTKDVVMSSAKLLRDDEKATALAKIISGAKVTPSALEHAKQLIEMKGKHD